MREEFTDQMAGKCLTDLCSEARQKKWIIDPTYELIVQGQTLKKKAEEKKGEQKKTKKAKLDTTKNQQQLPLTSQPVQIAQCQPTISLNQMNQHQYQMNPYQRQIFQQNMYHNFQNHQQQQQYLNPNFINQASHQPHNLYNLQSVASSSLLAPVSSLSSAANLYKNVNSDINADLMDETTQDGFPDNSF